MPLPFPSNLVTLLKGQGVALVAYLDFRLLKSLVFKAFRNRKMTFGILGL